jgi:hypothetical protein
VKKLYNVTACTPCSNAVAGRIIQPGVPGFADPCFRTFFSVMLSKCLWITVSRYQ